MTDWKALCDELVDAIQDLMTSYIKADAALAAEADGPAVPEDREPASVAGEPSDEELAQAAKAAIHEYKYPTELVYFLDSDSREYEPFLLALRAAIAADRSRWGHQPAPPAEGEVAELVAALELEADAQDPATELQRTTHDQLRRAADLLKQCQAALVPVASDTRYEFSVYDNDFTEQAGGSAPTYAQALSEGQHYLAQYQQDGPHTLELRRVEVLPPGAFPAPDDAPLQVLPEDAQVIEPTEHTILVPARTPVPVSERPWERQGWCDEQGWCWWFCPKSILPNGMLPYWCLGPATEPKSWFTHCLPAHALPLPGVEVEQ